MAAPGALTDKQPGARGWRAWQLACVALLVMVALGVMLMPSGQMAELRAALPPVSRFLSRLDRVPGPLDMYHVVFFALLGLALRVVLPQTRWGWLLVGLGVLAAASELLQFGTVGRTPKLIDVRDDLIGAGIGLLAGALVLWGAGRAKAPQRAGLASPLPECDTSTVTSSTTVAGPSDPRGVLARCLADYEPGALADAVARHGSDAILATCDHEGVVSLVHARIVDDPSEAPTLGPLRDALATRARLCAGRSLLCVSEARRIQQALADAHIPALWLKGIAVGQWLYPAMHLRDIADLDLLLPDHATLLRAAQVLAPLGYTLPNPHTAGDLVVRELLAYSERLRLELDLHSDLSNGALFAGRLPWEAILRDSIPLPALGPQARGLCPIHALLHASLHLASGRLVWERDRLRWLYDIHLLALRFDEAGWAAVTAAATEAKLADPLAYALRASHGTFGTPVDDAVLQRLDSAASREQVRSERLHRWAYFQLASWRRWPTLGMRLRWLRQLLFPDMAHLRARYGEDGASGLKVTWRRLLDGTKRWRRYASRPGH